MDLITILGPTASGKTHWAVKIAERIGAEIISADSRQVYRGMDIGTGKDLEEYTLPDGTSIPAHLIDIVPAGEKYDVFQYQRDFLHAYHDIRNRGKRVLLCGGSGLYIESVLRAYRLSPVPQNAELRKRLSQYSLPELTDKLRSYGTLHNTTDVDTPQRAIRAIEIAEYYQSTPIDPRPFPKLKSLVIGISVSREERRRLISERLDNRLRHGLIEEVEGLLASGISAEQLIYYGLEYKFVTLYLTHKLTLEQMHTELEIAIHQFAKRQMTWFRGMERRGLSIHWLDRERLSAFLS